MPERKWPRAERHTRQRWDVIPDPSRPRSYKRGVMGPKGWSAEKAKCMPFYPQTPELYDAWIENRREHMRRLNADPEFRAKKGKTPRGWGGKKKLIEHLKVVLRQRAERWYKMAVKQNIIETVDDERAEEALKELAVISMNPAIKVESRLAALNAILNFTKRKPAQKSEVTVRRAEDFLDEISKDIS